MKISAKTVDLAKAQALQQLNVTEDMVNITVIEEGAKGVFGFGAKPAIIEVVLKEATSAQGVLSTINAEEAKGAEDAEGSLAPGEDPAHIVKEFLTQVIHHMGLNMEVEVTKKDRRLYTNLTGDGMGILIGKRGQTIDSLQYLANLMINGRGVRDLNVILDTGNYRKRRRDTLESLAKSIARKVRDNGHSVKLEPMSRFERHIIHTALQNSRDVETISEGSEPHRFIVVSRKR